MVQVRSAKQDQIHNSIVSTLLALMDGLDPRGRVGGWVPHAAWFRMGFDWFRAHFDWFRMRCGFFQSHWMIACPVRCLTLAECRGGWGTVGLSCGYGASEYSSSLPSVSATFGMSRSAVQ